MKDQIWGDNHFFAKIKPSKWSNPLWLKAILGTELFLGFPFAG
jgi:hypothetical protein